MDHVISRHSVYSWLAESMRTTRYTKMVCTKCNFAFDSNEDYENHKDSKVGYQNSDWSAASALSDLRKELWKSINLIT